ncbi:MAG TPA: chaperone modulator CbpM [Ramlibacter sp.]|nr:chaperone modulator CbpM [Ramlibacter sp.]
MQSDWMWLHADELVSQHELALICSMSSGDLDELVEYGALAPLQDRPGAGRFFSANCIPLLRKVSRLRVDFDLDLFTAGLIFGYLQRVEDLEQQVRSLEARLPHPLHPSREGPAQ